MYIIFKRVLTYTPQAVKSYEEACLVRVAAVEANPVDLPGSRKPVLIVTTVISSTWTVYHILCIGKTPWLLWMTHSLL